MMQDAIQKAAVLVEALPYIQRFRGKTVVVKLGGAAMDLDQGVASVLADVALMEAVGMRPVVVHGGGPFISQRMKELGQAPVFVQGLRVTDAATLQVAESVLIDFLNARLVEELRAAGAKAVGIHPRGPSCLIARKMPPVGVQDQAVDLGFVGEVETVASEVILALCREGIVPVVAPVALSRESQVLNINADSAAAAIAAAIVAEKIVFMSDTHGILRDPADPESLASTIHEHEVNEMVARGVITKGMLPKVEACLTALHAGVSKAHVVDGRIPHSLLLEVYTDAGIGTEIIA
jgi:acetylglutamate kinase